MCGITGCRIFKSSEVERLVKVGAATEKLTRRGPDTGGTYSNSHLSLGHRRLSIIDTTEAAAQPMHDSSGRYCIVFNGEIFNYKELARLHLGATIGNEPNSDTEVLLQLLILHREACLHWLNGFFAFAFYDNESEQLLLVRDRFGKKPLLYCLTDSYCAFASEMKALLSWDIPKKINATVLFQYLQLNYVPQPLSILEGVRKLEQGHFMILGPNGLERHAAYYSNRLYPEHYDRYDYATAQKILLEKMEQATVSRMISDVPLGAFLSGGIDSSAVVALASRHTDKLKTFSVGYKDNPFFDETSYALLVAKKYNTDHTVFSLTTDDFLQHVFNVLEYIDEPFADSSALPVFILSMETRKHVTVALSGDGGDEVFAGYNKYAAEHRLRNPSPVMQLAISGGPLWKILPKSRNSKITNLFRQLHRFSEGARLSPQERHWRWTSIASAETARSYLSPKMQSAISEQHVQEFKNSVLGHISTNDFNEVLLADMNLALISDMLVKVDLMSMANSLEVRSPFLDREVVEFANSLPAHYKIDGSLKKKIVQDAFRSLLPEELYNRPKKGFEIPLLGWFRKELWSTINDDLLSDEIIREQGIFSPEAIALLKKKLHSSNPEDSHATIWALLVFQHWYRTYFA
jgi:asparagine synthase (glutamine-hydrolysing)